MTAPKLPAGLVVAQWVGPHDALTPDREILDQDGQPTGEIIPGAFLTAGESTHVIPEWELEQSSYWRKPAKAADPPAPIEPAALTPAAAAADAKSKPGADR